MSKFNFVWSYTMNYIDREGKYVCKAYIIKQTWTAAFNALSIVKYMLFCSVNCLSTKSIKMWTNSVKENDFITKHSSKVIMKEIKFIMFRSMILPQL